MSDFTLYKVSQEFESLVDLIERDVLEDWEVEELKRRLSSAAMTQGKEIVKFYVNKMAEIEAIKAEMNRLKVLKSSKEASIDRIKERLSENMRALKLPKITSPLGNITLSLDGTTKSVEVDDDIDFTKIPEEYIKTSLEIKKSDIKKALESGETFDGVRIKETPSKVVFRLGQESKEYIEKAGE